VGRKRGKRKGGREVGGGGQLSSIVSGDIPKARRKERKKKRKKEKKKGKEEVFRTARSELGESEGKKGEGKKKKKKKGRKQRRR